MCKRFFIVGLLMCGLMTGAVHAADLMPLVPADAAFVLNVNLGKILTNDMVKKQISEGMAKQTPDQKQAFDEFVQKTGIDPLSHLKSLMIFLSGKAVASSQEQSAAVLIDGTFNVPQILNSIGADSKAKEDVVIGKFAGFDSITSKNKDEGMGVFLDGSTAVIGSNEGIKAVTDIKQGKGKGLDPKSKIGALVAKVAGNAMVWGVGVIPPALKEKAKQNPQAAPLAAFEYVHFSFNKDEMITFHFAGEVDKKENIDGVMTTLNGFLAMIKMLAGQAPEAGEILNMVKIENEGTMAKITLVVPTTKIDEIRQKIETRMKQVPPAPAPAPGQ